MITATHHAAERYCERVQAGSIEEARTSILSSSRAIEVAAAFGCAVVRLGGGARLVLDGLTVVTVYEPHVKPRQIKNHHGAP